MSRPLILSIHGCDNSGFKVRGDRSTGAALYELPVPHKLPAPLPAHMSLQRQLKISSQIMGFCFVLRSIEGNNKNTAGPFCSSGTVLDFWRPAEALLTSEGVMAGRRHLYSLCRTGFGLCLSSGSGCK